MCSDIRAPNPTMNWYAERAHEHVVQFYESEAYLLDMLSDFVQDTIAHGEACLVVATSEHLLELERQIQNAKSDLPGAAEIGQVLLIDARQLMARFMNGGKPDERQFRAVIGETINSLLVRWPSVRIFGEMVALTTANNNHAATIDIERLWNELQQQLDFTLYCGYPLSSFTSAESELDLAEICDAHSSILPAESFSELRSNESRMRQVAILQQKALRLEHEIAQRKDVEERLKLALDAERSARQRAESALRMRDQFVSVAAHELKTPLTSLIGHVQLMDRWIEQGMEVDTDRRQSSLQTVSRQASKLGRLVNQLLDVSRLEAGQLEIERLPLDLSGLVRQIAHEFEQSEPAYQFVVESPDELIVQGDELRLEQVLINLLANAVRFSPEENCITIVIDDSGAELVEVSVRDRGIGIRAEDLERVFEPYYQAHEKQSHSGMGLGLHISKQIVTMHGGTICAEAPSDGGTLIRVRLPILVPETLPLPA